MPPCDTALRNAEPSRDEVSILVLVDAALRHLPKPFGSVNHNEVSILVLVDAALRRDDDPARKQ